MGLRGSGSLEVPRGLERLHVKPELADEPDRRRHVAQRKPDYLAVLKANLNVYPAPYKTTNKNWLC